MNFKCFFFFFFWTEGTNTKRLKTSRSLDSSRTYFHCEPRSATLHYHPAIIEMFFCMWSYLLTSQLNITSQSAFFQEAILAISYTDRVNHEPSITRKTSQANRSQMHVLGLWTEARIPVKIHIMENMQTPQKTKLRQPGTLS